MAAVTVIRKIGSLSFDATFEESHDSTLEVTDNPVETGVSVADHAYMKPLTVTITAGVSDRYVSGRDDPFLWSTDTRPVAAFAALQELQRKAEPFDVQTGLRLYKNMVITSLKTTQDKDSSNALIFTADLREVIIVNTQIVTYPPRKAGAPRQQGGKAKQRGEQQGKNVDKDSATGKKTKASLLKRMGADKLYKK